MQDRPVTAPAQCNTTATKQTALCDSLQQQHSSNGRLSMSEEHDGERLRRLASHKILNHFLHNSVQFPPKILPPFTESGATLRAVCAVRVLVCSRWPHFCILSYRSSPNIRYFFPCLLRAGRLGNTNAVGYRAVNFPLDSQLNLRNHIT